MTCIFQKKTDAEWNKTNSAQQNILKPSGLQNYIIKDFYTDPKSITFQQHLEFSMQTKKIEV